MPSWDNGTPTGLRPAPFGFPGSIPGDGVMMVYSVNHYDVIQELNCSEILGGGVSLVERRETIIFIFD